MPINPLRGAQAGLVAAVAFLVAMALDMALTRERTNDLRLLGRLTPGGRSTWPVTGTLLHLVNGSLLGIVFARSVRALPGPGWLRGLIFAQIENLALWPVMILMDIVHPAIRSGELPRYNRLVPFASEVFRHAIYGIVMGAVYTRIVGQATGADKSASAE